MKTTKTILKLFAFVVLGIASAATSLAQTNLGSDCGCPPLASRGTPVLLSTLAVSGGATDGELTATNTVLTCDKIYILDKKIYVPIGKSLTIAPGTLIKGRVAATPAEATALIIERGGKIFASGTPTCQIVFTAEADPMDGTYGISHHGDWGGVVILGKAGNNMTLANATSAFGGTCTGNCFGTGVGTAYVEGFTAADSRNQYGGGVSPDDNDNSGILKYVSIRHAGAVVVAANGNELNGLTLGSVGKGTTIDHIEVISSNDDGVEIFGGSVNLKYIAVMFGMDDMFDWDEAWTGKAQFLFGLAADSITTNIADNGFEADADDNKTNATPRSHPIIYNSTLIGNGSKNQNISDNSAHAAINGKELTEGEIYNSIFANFETGLNMQQTLSGGRTIEVYNNWNAGSFVVSCNTFVGNVESIKLDKAKASDGVAPSAADLTKFSTDNNLVPASIPGFDFSYAMNTSTNVVSDQYDATPNPFLSSTCTPPVDGFFSPASYRGAFESNKKSWLSDWAYGTIVQFTAGLIPCPTDINGDGITNNVDFLQLLGQFNQSCH